MKSTRRFAFKKTLSRIPVLVAIALIAIGFILSGWYCVSYVQTYLQSIENAYAKEWASIIVVEHLERERAWPKNWDELRVDYERVYEREGSVPFSFDRLQDEVSIDFEFRLRHANVYDIQSFRVIRHKRGFGHELPAPPPNERVWQYIVENRLN